MATSYMTVDEILQSEELPAMKVDQSGIILDANRAFAKEFGFGVDELTGQPLTRIVPARLQTSHDAGFARFVATGKASLLGQEVVIPLLNAEGREQLVEAYIEGEQRGGRWVFAALLTPVGLNRE